MVIDLALRARSINHRTVSSSYYNLYLCFRIKFESSDYRADKELPVYSRVQCGYPVGNLVNILLKSDLDIRKICDVQPLGVTENSYMFNPLNADSV